MKNFDFFGTGDPWYMPVEAFGFLKCRSEKAEKGRTFPLQEFGCSGLTSCLQLLFRFFEELQGPYCALYLR